MVFEFLASWGFMRICRGSYRHRGPRGIDIIENQVWVTYRNHRKLIHPNTVPCSEPLDPEAFGCRAVCVRCVAWHPFSLDLLTHVSKHICWQTIHTSKSSCGNRKPHKPRSITRSANVACRNHFEKPSLLRVPRAKALEMDCLDKVGHMPGCQYYVGSSAQPTMQCVCTCV